MTAVNQYAVRKTAIQIDTELALPSGAQMNINGTVVTLTQLLAANSVATPGAAEASKALVLGTKKDIDHMQFGSVATSLAILHGAGISGTPETTASADKNFLGYWTQTTAATGDCRGLYLKTYFGGAGSGEALRPVATVNFAGAAAVGGTINGMHCSLEVAAGTTISGQASAARFTLDYATATRTMDANVSCLLLCSNIGANNTPHAKNAFMRVVDDGSVALGKLFRLPTVASAGLLAAHTTDAITHSIRCVDEAGTVFYVMCTTTSSNRTGGA